MPQRLREHQAFRLNFNRNIWLKPGSVFSTINQHDILSRFTEVYPPEQPDRPNEVSIVWLDTVNDPVILQCSKERFMDIASRQTTAVFRDQFCLQYGAKPVVESFFGDPSNELDPHQLAHFVAHLVIKYAGSCRMYFDLEPERFEYQELVYPNIYNPDQMIIAFNFPTVSGYLAALVEIALTYLDSWIQGISELPTESWRFPFIRDRISFLRMMEDQANIQYLLRKDI